MATMKVQGVPLLGQPTDGVCWFMCAKMVYACQQANGGGSMKDPESNSVLTGMFSANTTLPAPNSALLKRTINMCPEGDNEISLDYDCLWYILSAFGPIWTSVWKNWRGNDYGHVVTIIGTRDGANGGVLINDPMPMPKGASYWLSWKEIRKAVNDQDQADWHYMLC